jgi:hypothetical protein
MKSLLICALIVNAAVNAVNLRTQDQLSVMGIDMLAEDLKVLAGGQVFAQDGQCVTVYSECNYKGQST